MTRTRRNLVRLASAAAITGAMALVPLTATAAPVPVDFTGGSWDGGTGYPLDADGGTGVSGAVGDLGNGLTVTVNYAANGTAVASDRQGTDQGNLNVLDGAPIADLNNPGTPVPGQCQATDNPPVLVGEPSFGCHEVSGFALGVESEGANNTGTLDNFVRYDFVFNSPVTVPNGITITDIDSFIIRYQINFGGTTQQQDFPVFQDAVGFEAWTGAPGAPGTGSPGTATTGPSLTTDTLDGVTFARTSATSAGGRGGLADSANTDLHATFTPDGAILGFSLYYWDHLQDQTIDGADNVVDSYVSIEPFDVEPLPSQVEIVKEVIDGATPWSFDVTITGSDESVRTVTLTDAAPSTIVDVDPGETYQLDETPPAGFTLDSIDCGDNESAFVAPLDQTDGAETTCTVTNRPAPTTTTTTTTTTVPPDKVTLPRTGTSATSGTALAAVAALLAGLGALAATRRTSN